MEMDLKERGAKNTSVEDAMRNQPRSYVPSRASLAWNAGSRPRVVELSKVSPPMVALRASSALNPD
jgi:hypothetical protein